MLLIPALVAINSRPLRRSNIDGSRRINMNMTWLAVAILLAIVIGFRFQVGGDWNNYFRYLDAARFLTYSDLATEEDPGYMALNILSLDLGWGMTGVNVIGAVIFAIGLVVFLRSLPRPWLGLACAIPYLVIVVSMGYTRQGIALGLIMIGLVALQRRRFLKFAIWVTLGALFHKSAVLVIPLAALTGDRNRIQALGVVGIVGFFAYDALLSGHSARLVDVYIDQELLESQGAFIRLAMNAVPATLFLIYGRRFLMTAAEYRLWRAMSLLALLMFVALLGTGFTTALDRMALYVIPLQLVVFSHLPDALGRPNGRNTAVVGAIVFYYASVQFVWLNFATHSARWVPYQMGLVPY